MFGFLKVFNLFPYPHLWRIGKEPYHSDKCTIIISILIILGIGTMFVEKFISVIRQNELAFTSKTIIDSSPPLTTIHTYDNEGDTKPFMFAFDLYAGNPSISRNDTSFTIRAYIDYISGGYSGSRVTTYETVTLENCTTKHFHMFTDIDKRFS